MSGTFPSTQGLRGLNFTNNQPNLIAIAASGRRQAKSQGAQFFSFTVQTPPMSTTEHKDLMGFLAAQRGQFSTFEIVLPNISKPAGSVTGNPLRVATDIAAGLKSIAVTSGLTNKTDYLKRGDVVRFGTDPKVYMLTADVDTDGSGAGTLNIEPGLITAIDGSPSAVAVETNDVKFTVFMGSPITEYNTGVADYTTLEFEAREAF